MTLRWTAPLLAALLAAGGCANRKPGDPLSMRKAQAAYESGDYERSVQFSTDALNNGADPGTAHLLRAKAYEKMGEPKWAVADYEAARAANPSSVEPAVRQARLHQALGESEKAETLLEIVNGPMAETYSLRDRFLGLAVHGEVCLHQGNLQRGMELLQNALSVAARAPQLSGDPIVAVVHYNVSRIHFERGEYRQARAAYDRYLEVARIEEAGATEDLYTMVVLHFLCGDITRARETIAKLPADKQPAAQAVLTGEALSVRALYDRQQKGKEERK